MNTDKPCTHMQTLAHVYKYMCNTHVFALVTLFDEYLHEKLTTHPGHTVTQARALFTHNEKCFSLKTHNEFQQLKVGENIKFLIQEEGDTPLSAKYVSEKLKFGDSYSVKIGNKHLNMFCLQQFQKNRE